MLFYIQIPGSEVDSLYTIGGEYFLLEDFLALCADPVRNPCAEPLCGALVQSPCAKPLCEAFVRSPYTHARAPAGEVRGR